MNQLQKSKKFNTIYNDLIKNATDDNTLYKKTIELIEKQVESFVIDEDKKAKYLLEYTMQTSLSFHQSATDKTIALLELEEKEKLTILEVEKFKKEYELRVKSFNKEMQLKRDTFNSELIAKFLTQKYQNRVDSAKFKKELELKIKTFNKEMDFKVKSLNTEFKSKFLLQLYQNRVDSAKFKQELGFKIESFNKDIEFNNRKFTKEIALKQNIAQMESDSKFNLAKYQMDVNKEIENIKESNRLQIELARLNTQISLAQDDNATKVNIHNSDPQGVRETQKKLYARQTLGFNENANIKKSEHISQVLSMALSNGLEVEATAWSAWQTALGKIGDGYTFDGTEWIKKDETI